VLLGRGGLVWEDLGHCQPFPGVGSTLAMGLKVWAEQVSSSWVQSEVVWGGGAEVYWAEERSP